LVKEAKLTFFPDSLEYRFATPDWPGPPRPASHEQLLAQLRDIDPERCQRLTFSGGSPLKHPQFVDLALECRRRGFKRLALESDAASLARRGVATLLGRLGFRELFVFMGGLHEAVQDAVLAERRARTHSADARVPLDRATPPYTPGAAQRSR
jgi:MoaA/NifB/PqqE/SkfB family radical SAM enzyme